MPTIYVKRKNGRISTNSKVWDDIPGLLVNADFGAGKYAKLVLFIPTIAIDANVNGNFGIAVKGTTIEARVYGVTTIKKHGNQGVEIPVHVEVNLRLAGNVVVHAMWKVNEDNTEIRMPGGLQATLEVHQYDDANLIEGGDPILYQVLTAQN